MATMVVTMVLAVLAALVVISIFARADEAPVEPEETGLGDLLEP
jgi:hypothetical protein